jgi:hypothetical protein
MQSVIIQYQEHNQSLQRNNANALASLDQNHRQEVVELQVGYFRSHINILISIDRTIWQKFKTRLALK